uniref:Uncharacterized protein n=2 Tax=Brassica oleracea TaxID=3712 RepID=A0A0D2ZQQ9_BRAOL|nr:unnamed protein product [Brassica oleracea]
MMKIFKDVSKIHKKSTSTRAHVTEPSLFISEKPKSKSENSLEDLKDFSDSFPIFDDYDEKLMESLITCEDECDLPSPKPDLMFDIDNKDTNGLTYFEPEHLSSLVLVSQVFEEEPLDYPQQVPRLDTRISLDDDPDHIFDEEDELGPIFDEEAPSITSINMENHLFFDPGTTPTPLSKEHCEKLDLLNSMPEMLKYELFVLGKETLISDLNKYISCTYDPGILMNGAVHGCRRDDPISSQRPRKLDDQFRLFPTLQAVEESYRKSTYTSPFSRYEACHGRNQVTKDVPMELKCFLPSSLSVELKENQTKEAAKSSPQRKPLEQVILNEPKVILQSIPCQSQKHCKDHELIVSAYHENVLNTSISLRKQIFTWLSVINSQKGQEKEETKGLMYQGHGTGSKRDLRSNPFEEGGNDVPRSKHRPAWIMDTAQDGNLVNQLDPTEVSPLNDATMVEPEANLEKKGLREWMKPHIMELDTHEHFGRAGGSDTYLGELVELNQSDTYICELDKLSKLSDTTLKLNELSDIEEYFVSYSAPQWHTAMSPGSSILLEDVCGFMTGIGL